VSEKGEIGSLEAGILRNDETAPESNYSIFVADGTFLLPPARGDRDEGD
jgi:hypothetical protein